MTVNQIGEIMDILTAAYPQFGRQLTSDKKATTVKLWASMFAEDDGTTVAAAVKALISSKVDDWPPSIGAIKEKLRLITTPPGMTEQEAWGLVAKAIRNSTYSSAEEFDKLPHNIQRLVGSPSQLRTWGMMDTDTISSVIASNFMRSYRARVKQDSEIAALPSDVRAMLESVSSELMLEGHTDK